MKNIALIVASGIGSRMGTDVPKQYLKIKNKAILTHTIEIFLNHPDIDEVKVVINKDHLDLYHQAVKHLNVLSPSFGGVDRKNSVLNGLRDLKGQQVQKVLIHDAVRPFVSSKIISDVIEALNAYDAVDVGVKPKDTIKSIENGHEVLNREFLYQTQTPQGFKFDIILAIHEELKNLEVTDDITMAIKKGIEVKVVQGNYENFKITTAEDLVISGLLL